MARRKALGAIEAIPGHPGLWHARKGSLRMYIIALQSDQLCIFSPIAGLESEHIAALKPMGKVAFLCAPNHYHNLGIDEYAEAFPYARLCAPEAAVSRLEARTGRSFENLDRVSATLPEPMAFVHTQGLKTGEVWLRVTSRKITSWIVVDAFSGPNADDGEDESTPRMLGTFPKMGVRDAAVYSAWALKMLDGEHAPQRLLPCHGAIVESKTLNGELRTLVMDLQK